MKCSFSALKRFHCGKVCRSFTVGLSEVLIQRYRMYSHCWTTIFTTHLRDLFFILNGHSATVSSRLPSLVSSTPSHHHFNLPLWTIVSKDHEWKSSLLGTPKRAAVPVPFFSLLANGPRCVHSVYSVCSRPVCAQVLLLHSLGVSYFWFCLLYVPP